tara:strand:- start:332 stop:448 length:117 start_codon:yes stop_codon:yes gene_type:complete
MIAMSMLSKWMHMIKERSINSTYKIGVMGLPPYSEMSS